MVPATKQCGIFAKSATTGRPAISLPKDKVNKDGFKLEASIFVKPEQKTIKIKKERNKKNNKNKKDIIPPDGGQGVNTIEEIIQNPIIAKYVTPEVWKEVTGKDVDEDDVLHVVKNKKEGKCKMKRAKCKI